MYYVQTPLKPVSSVTRNTKPISRGSLQIYRKRLDDLLLLRVDKVRSSLAS